MRFHKISFRGKGILNIDYQKFYIPKLFYLHKEYIRDGKRCLYDKCRKKYIAKTPEEVVRQSVIRYFRWILHTPLRNIQTEVSLKRYGHLGRKDRADILLLRPDFHTILAVIECKAVGIPIDEKVIDQLLRYANALNTEYAFATNGTVLKVYRFNKKDGYIETECPTSYKEMCQSYCNETPQVMTLYSRADLEQLHNLKYIRMNYDNYLGRQSNNQYLPFFANLCDGLRDISVFLNSAQYQLFSLEKDYGIRTMKIVVPAGGEFNNDNYRVFEIKDKENHFYKCGFAVSVYGGASEEKTMLAVAVDDGNRCHHALQLILDTNIEISKSDEKQCYKIYHSGKINVGRKGRAKVKEVLDYVKEKMPSLIDKKTDRIYLGKFHDYELIYVTSKEFISFFENLISYVLVLEEFRRIKTQ